MNDFGLLFWIASLTKYAKRKKKNKQENLQISSTNIENSIVNNKINDCS